MNIPSNRLRAALLPVLILATGVGAISAQDARAAIQDCKRAFRVKPPEFKLPLTKADPTPIQLVDAWAKTRLDALKPLGAFHDEDTAKYLLKLSTGIERDLLSTDKQREKLRKAIASGYKAMQKAQKNSRTGVLTTGSPGAMKYIKNSNEASYFRRIRDGLEAESDEIRRQVEEFDEAAATFALGEVIGDKTQPVALKTVVARRVAALGESMVPVLTASLDKTKQPAEIAAVVLAIGSLGTAARPVADKLIALVDHEDAGVRERAAVALSVVAVPGAIEPMVKLLARERGVAQKRIAAALEVLTRQKFGINISAWQGWFAAEGAVYTSGAKELGGGTPSSADEFNKKNYYYGIRQDGKAILYILDCSGSMMVSFKNPRFADKERTQPMRAREGEVTRMDACRNKLSEALGQLSSNQRFNILVYSFEPKLYKKGMQDASKKNIEAAQKYLQTLTADGATNIYDTMQLGFQATGRGSYDKAYSVECDMMFVLTDGKPTLPGSSDGYDMVDSILGSVRKWNALKRVVIHTIGIGKDLNEEFMSKLASENGGEFRNEDGEKRDGKKKDTDKPAEGSGGEPKR